METLIRIDPNTATVTGHLDKVEVIRIYSNGVQSVESLPVNLEKAKALVDLYSRCLDAYERLQRNFSQRGF